MLALIIGALLAQEAPGYSEGPFNLILRWGATTPVVIRYETRARCEMAAVMVVTQQDDTLANGKRIEASPLVRAPNALYAFCIPG